MSDTDTRPHDQWADNTLTDNQLRNRESAALIPVARSGAIPMNFAQMVDYAKYMSTAQGAVGAHLMRNVGACLAVMEIANQFGMPAYAVARQSYLVNGRVAFMGQFFHAIIEDYAPLKKGPNGRKLQFRFEGEGETLKIIVSATFIGASEPVEYESPMWKDVKVKNSPLWQSEPKRQFKYFGVRGWQTVNWPEGMLQAISEDEAAALPPSEYARDVTPLRSPDADALRERLRQVREDHPEGTPREGFTEGFTEGHFTETHGDTTVSYTAPADPEAVKTDAAVENAIAAAKPEPAKTDAPKEPKAPKKKKADDAKPTAAPKTPAEWVPWCRAWLDAETDPAEMRKRWQGEQKLRNEIGVTSEERDPVFAHFQDRLTALEGES